MRGPSRARAQGGPGGGRARRGRRAAAGAGWRLRRRVRKGGGARADKGSHARLFAGAAAEAPPGAADEALDRLEVGLVGHLRALADPVAEVEVRQAVAPALLDLPEHVIGSQARAAPAALVARLDR